MNGPDLDLKDILLKGDYVTQEDIKKAVDYAATHHATVLEYLLEQGIITKTLLGQAVAEYYRLPFADLAVNPPDKSQVLKIPQEVAGLYHAVIAKETPEGLLIATDNPAREGLEGALKNLFPDAEFSLAFANTEDILECFAHYQQSLEARFIKIITGQKKVAPEILEEILKDAMFYRASDVHFEPREEKVFARFRIDGVLHEAGSFPKTFYENVLNRIKVQANLKIDEHFGAQDGAIRFVHNDNAIDARVSIVPTLNGEKVVMRLLSEYIKVLNLADLGLSEQNYGLVEAAAKKPFGMVLVTGPTGSGKTTTLYALIKMLNQPEINITTIEDPVEYRVPTINQIQVNTATNLTFDKGLRSIVRQDPDIILVGEIRDRETAEVGINAALTGHLLLSTFHANNAASAIPRLLDMGVEPYLAASTLEIIVAQRLLRRICDNCRYGVSVTLEELGKMMPHPESCFSQHETLYAGKGCQACHFTGYKGRIGIFEIIEMTPALRELAVKRPSSEQVWEQAKKEGARTLFEDGLEKVKNGLSTLSELVRVAPPQK